MSNEDDWRITTNGGDYLLHQQKKVALADRRPVIRNAGDLVGPGIGAGAVRIDDYNDLLATFNGYYSSVPGAANAPDWFLDEVDREAFVGQVISDAELGGRQVFTGLSTGTQYTRTFNRSPVDPEALGWTSWSGSRIPATADGYDAVLTAAASGWDTVLVPPTLYTIGPDVYERSDAGITIRQQGVYTGSIRVGSQTAVATTSVLVSRPIGDATLPIGHPGVTLSPAGFFVPFTVWCTDDQQGVGVRVLQSSGSTHQCWWTITVARIGDAV